MNRPYLKRLKLRAIALSFFLFMPIWLIAMPFVEAVRDGMFDDFGGQLKSIFGMMITGEMR